MNCFSYSRDVTQEMLLKRCWVNVAKQQLAGFIPKG